jgi:hypothetical protein
MVHICIEGKQIRGGSHTPSPIAWIHESEFICVKLEGKVKHRSVRIKPSKTMQPRKQSIGHLKSLTFYHPVELPSVSMLLDKQGSIELHNDLIVPILLKDHHISQVLCFACIHHLIKESVILVLHVLQI